MKTEILTKTNIFGTVAITFLFNFGLVVDGLIRDGILIPPA